MRQAWLRSNRAFRPYHAWEAVFAATTGREEPDWESAMVTKSTNESKLLNLVLAAVVIVMVTVLISAAPSTALAADDSAGAVQDSTYVLSGPTDLQAADTWLATQGDTVYIARSSKNKIYHYSSTCSGMRSPRSISLSDAIAGGYRPCEKCAHGSGGGSGSSGGGSSSGSSAVPAVPADDPSDWPSNVWSRHYGGTALDTMSAIVKAGSFPKNGAVMLATVDGYWDALTAAGIAGMGGAPVLMTDGKSLSPQTKALLELLKPRKVIVCGGPAAISNTVASQAASAAGIEGCVRCSGSDAVHTALDIYGKAPSIMGVSWSRTAFVCTNDGYWDALAAAPISYAKQAPIFLTNGRDSISPDVLEAMRGNIDNVYIIGGKMAVSDNVQKTIESVGIRVSGRFAGADAVETSALVAQYGIDVLGMAPDGMGVATTGGYWDALSGAALCGEQNSVLILVDGPLASSISSVAGGYYIKSGHVFGGPAAVAHSTFNSLVNRTG